LRADCAFPHGIGNTGILVGAAVSFIFYINLTRLFRRGQAYLNELFGRVFTRICV
jgi:hypothetical protein